MRISDEGPDSREDGRAFVAYLPRLGDAAPDLFRQASLFGDDLNPDDTVMDWLGDITQAIWHEERNSAQLDSELLTQVAKYKRADELGLLDAAIGTRRYHSGEVHLNTQLGQKAESLVIDTPPSRIARIKGFLNQMAYLQRSLLLNLEGGQRLRVLWEPESAEEVKSLLGTHVVLEGKLEYRPNGQPLILLADRARRATDSDNPWSVLPAATSPAAGERRLLAPREHNPLARLRGVLDGQVDNETFTRMVEEFSRS